MIKFKNVYKKYKLDKSILTAVNDVNFEVDDGEIYGIIGYSGAGKSTLVRILDGLEAPTSGSIEINGKDISKLSNKSLREQRKKIGMIFQHFNLLWSRTIIENVELPLEISGISKAERRKQAEEFIKLVGLEGRENDYPSELSGGQKQRVGIARALANKPEILISDEATSALDPQTTDEILDLLLKINKELNLTVLLITHEMHAIRKVAKKVAVMEEGKIVEHGDVYDIFQNPKQNITKRFVNEDNPASSGELNMTVDDILDKYPNGTVLKLSFKGNQSQQPVVSNMMREFDTLEMSIIEATIHQTQSGSIGSLIIQLLGSPKDQDKAIEYLNSLNIETEVINRG
ncbi:methionine ABC transporter ATP-binding protein [Apilactobacillus micheneri]|uniref:Methionine ABC transporter ATP-binding protein n=1 Tax=Apilactobacillus micheneri TaxID=1899430 RepID=A0ABY2YW80_9LACO|nr:methionine ABC transporter ATP-binding protein [Apilactobacillus micheneri]TPR24318.1 methionine ABC transporter ATP-binding protein [Apilactobacillus micheneri]TPR25337.1 methionine ABC transporter ATP-binding protein [Apilactobacillus micheneri]TPR27649.1 methionine ABC transporter ATP-binding protein [Apilactobacillus micheneri]TPR28914.1 methionine ABC transporter ATP-binding protein [Apilactobacillus micheneri]TPR29936.1 methionine ABC transporter ATP-binding protein [Apilactobacillus 